MHFLVYLHLRILFYSHSFYLKLIHTMDKKKLILVPIDFSEICLIALEQACNVAEAVTADITIMSVIEDSHIPSDLQKREYANEIRTKLEDLAEGIRTERNLIVNILIESGKVYQRIVETSEILNADLVVMGTNGSTTPWRKRLFIGSNSLRVVREATCPVITIRGKHHRNGCRRIVLPLDLSEQTREKVNPTIELAQYFGATIHLCTMLDTKDEFIVNKLTAQINQVEGYIKDAGIDCTAEILTGYHVGKTYASTILNFADRIKADLIVIMSQKEVGFTGFFLGSTAQELINLSEIPVCSIGPAAHDDLYSFTPY